jgi:hypothetical protein
MVRRVGRLLPGCGELSAPVSRITESGVPHPSSAQDGVPGQLSEIDFNAPLCGNILRRMQSTSKRLRAAKFALIALTAMCVLLLGARHFFLYGQDKSGFPDGFDAVQAAPGSHKVIFENEFIRVLQVTLPPAGHAEPMHFHRWPSLFIGYDTGGTTAHIRYHAADGKVHDQPSKQEPVHPGEWGAFWMKPEPMHSIEVVENAKPGPGGFPGWLRVEIKCAR